MTPDNIRQKIEKMDRKDICKKFGIPGCQTELNRLRALMTRWVLRVDELFSRFPDRPTEKTEELLPVFLKSDVGTGNSTLLFSLKNGFGPRKGFQVYNHSSLCQPQYHIGYLLKHPSLESFLSERRYSNVTEYLQNLSREEYRYVGYLTRWLLDYVRLLVHTWRQLGIGIVGSRLKKLQAELETIRIARHGIRPLPPRQVPAVSQSHAFIERKTNRLLRNMKCAVHMAPAPCLILFSIYMEDAPLEQKKQDITRIVLEDWIKTPGYVRKLHLKYVRRMMALDTRTIRRLSSDRRANHLENFLLEMERSLPCD